MARPTLDTQHEALAYVTAETGIDPAANPYVLFAHDSAVRCARYLIMDKIERRARDEGLTKARLIVPPDDYGFRGAGQRIWAAAQKMLDAKHGQKEISIDELAKELDGLRKAGVIPARKKGEDHSTLPVRTFVVSLTFLRDAAGLPRLTENQLYYLAWGLGIATNYRRDDHGHHKLDHWRELVADALRIPHDTSYRTSFAVEAYYLVAWTTQLMVNRQEETVPSAAQLAAFVTETEAKREHPPVPVRAVANDTSPIAGTADGAS